MNFAFGFATDICEERLPIFLIFCANFFSKFLTDLRSSFVAALLAGVSSLNRRVSCVLVMKSLPFCSDYSLTALCVIHMGFLNLFFFDNTSFGT